MPAQVVEPTDAAGVASALERADAGRLAVAVRGAGTKLRPTRADIVLSTTRLKQPIDHVAGDLVAQVPAGASLDAVNEVLRREQQWLPLDPPWSDHATIGGIVATDDSGPRRHRYGRPRDLIIGVELALVDGRTAKAGGRVVKNVAGYDLSKLVCGSLGSLAVVTSATFKLAPVAPSSETLVATVDEIRRAGELALALAASPLNPSAIELQSPPPRLLLRFETTPRAVDEQVRLASEVCGRHGAAIATLHGQAEVDAWRAHEARTWRTSGTVVKLAVLPTAVADVLPRIPILGGSDVPCDITGRAALGIVFVRLAGDAARHATIVRELRRETSARGGSVAVLSAPAEIASQVPAWDSVGDAAAIMRAVKARFDPHGTLNPGIGAWEQTS